MSLGEMGAHARKKFYQFTDARRSPDSWTLKVDPGVNFPRLPKASAAPEALRQALNNDARNILRGHWPAFAGLELQIDDPPKWHKDYLAGKDLTTSESAFKLNHRALPSGADIKLIWELSRWYQLVRLAQAAYVLGDELAGKTCVRWLEDWTAHNPPYRGWNWTSALEAGMRLIQFTWIDGLLEAKGAEWGLEEKLARLRREILPAHVWFTWRHKSFGSSANNHLLGELAGLILATVRWPALARYGAPLEELQRRIEHEILAQFAEDGGNKEQALNYQIFSWEFCWQARAALLKLGMHISPQVENRLHLAAGFFTDVQVESDPWDYGDSDNAFVTPFFLDGKEAPLEWRDWLLGQRRGAAIAFWWGQPPSPPGAIQKLSREERGQERGGIAYGESRIAVDRWNLWTLRLDASPLGYLRTAAHGHLDALHLSVWHRGIAIVIDPGTGAYYADPTLRTYLASWEAHNGPHPVGLDYPRRLGPFLWSEHHQVPRIQYKPGQITARLLLPTGWVQRHVLRIEEDRCWQIEDSYEPNSSATNDAFFVRWQFAPGSWVKQLGEGRFSVNRAGVSIIVEVGTKWTEIQLIERESDRERNSGTTNDLEGIVSPSFRKTVFAPYLKLSAHSGKKPCVFRTAFLACNTS